MRLSYLLVLILAPLLGATQPLAHKSLESEIVCESLPIQGEVPSWIEGTFYRNGPAKFEAGGESVNHWFDGLAMLHAFALKNGKVSYTNQFLRSSNYTEMMEHNSINFSGFAQDPCRVHFQHSQIHNANVNVAKIAEEYVALTEFPLPVRFDPHTLETLGVLDYADQLPHEQCFESAHPHVEADESIINYLIEFGRETIYHIYRISPGTNTRTSLAKIPVTNPSYMHSFSQTERYLIFVEYPFTVNPLDLIQKTKPYISNFKWEPEKGSRLLVVDKKTGELVKTLHTQPFFSFHHINAFEKEDQIILDLISYDSPAVIQDLYLDAKSSHTKHRVSRLTLDLSVETVTMELLSDVEMELPRINDNFDGKGYQYVYGYDVNALYKLNTADKTHKKWSEERCLPSEPVFIPSPHGQEEDDGVVLSVILDEKSASSFLLILDAHTFEEVSRARVPHHIPAGLHGQFYR
ncbi:MAG: Apocarotenoid-15,15'-oxygenase [Chlamydiae bacterium]|nr:Apocarotenoid-15,15'-oxygenase [Chlamydiota bacterium]